MKKTIVLSLLVCFACETSPPFSQPADDLVSRNENWALEIVQFARYVEPLSFIVDAHRGQLNPAAGHEWLVAAVKLSSLVKEDQTVHIGANEKTGQKGDDVFVTGTNGERYPLAAIRRRDDIIPPPAAVIFTPGTEQINLYFDIPAGTKIATLHFMDLPLLAIGTASAPPSQP